jgi:ribosomal protein S18 acetylase RimI-like enzyme
LIRRATPADLHAIGRLGVLLVKTHHEFDPKRFIAPTARTEEAYGSFLVSQLEEASVVVLVADEDGEVIGYTYAGLEGRDYMSLRGPAGVVYDILVDPPHRGRGIGRMLLDATLDALERGGANQIVLSTAERNETAQRLFTRAGFRPTMVEMTRDQVSESSTNSGK